MDEERLPFFVYGTLLPGQSNAYLWADSVIKSEGATLTGCLLFDMGSFPMLVETGDGAVVGVVQTVAEADYEAVLARLDHLEDYDPKQPDDAWYRRIVREVVVQNASAESGRTGCSLRAWVYIGHQDAVRGLQPIPGGDWAAYAAKTFQNIEKQG